MARVGEVLGGGSDVVQHFAWDGNNIVLTFSGAPGAAGGGSLTDRYLTGSALDQVFADETALGNILWPLTDAEGTVRDVVNARGIVQDHLTYGAFGNLTGQTNPAAQPAFLYDGLLYDPIINKSYDQARWYDAETGRFLSPDPTGFAAGDVNLDRFTGNSPTNATDPTGLDRQLGPWSSWLNGIASDRGRWPATQILAGTLVGPTALVDTLPGAIQDAASAVREEMARVAAATNDPVQRFMATYVGPPLTQFGEVFAQLGNATGATAPLLATGATVPAAGAFLAHPITTNSLRALAVTGGTLNAFDAIQEGTFSGSDAFFVGAPFLGAQADLGRLRGYLDLNPPSNPLNYRFFVNRTTFTSNGIGAGDLRFVAPDGGLVPGVAPTYKATLGTSTSTNYKATFFKANPALEGEVAVHHAIEQQVLTKFPGVVTEAEINSLQNLRGIPKGVNSELHLSQIRKEWNQFYRPFEQTGTSPTKAHLLQKATEIDLKYGTQFTPPVGGG